MSGVELLLNLEYVPETGEIFLVDNNKKRLRKLIPDFNNMLVVSYNKKTLKMKCNKLVWLISYGVKPDTSEVVFHKDLNVDNYKLSNLVLISKEEHNKIQEAMKNLSGALRLIPHPTDVFSYVLEYKLNSRLKREVISDITVASQKLLKMQLYFFKLLGKYVISD